MTNNPRFGDFTCAECGGTFPKARSDDEAMAEYETRDVLTPLEGDDLAVVCDDCFKSLVSYWHGTTP